MMKNKMRPVPPGEILNEEFLKPLGMTASALARGMGVPANRVTSILKGERGITGETAIRLGAFLGTTGEFWMNLQKTYELRVAESSFREKIRKEIQKRGKIAASV